MNLKQKLARKLKKTGGFTLIEMLIVVAIIAILVAVSIPVIGGALDKARKATDAANERAAKAAAVIAYLTEEQVGGVAFSTGTDYNYDAANGILTTGTVNGYGQCSNHKGEYIVIKVVDTGTVSLKWSDDADYGSATLDSPDLMDTTTTPGG